MQRIFFKGQKLKFMQTFLALMCTLPTVVTSVDQSRAQFNTFPCNGRLAVGNHVTHYCIRGYALVVSGDVKSCSAVHFEQMFKLGAKINVVS